MGFQHDLNAADVGDQVINHIFGCGLTLAAIVGRPDVNDDVARRLQDVIDGLDMAVSAIRRAAFTALIADQDRRSDAAREVAVVAVPDSVAEVGVASSDVRRRLSRFAGEAFAYAMHGHDFYRVTDHELWAHESDGLLLSARSGSPLARRAGRVFYDVDTDVPLYYEDAHLGQLAQPCDLAADPSSHLDPHLFR